MRLIDADALKETMMKYYGCEDATKYGNETAEQQAHSYSTLMLYEVSDMIEDCIDNAPTVESDFKAGYKQAIIDGKTNYSRPTGEMINKTPYGWEYCSECGKVLEPQDKFCWNCGAKMKEAENDD